MSKYSDKELKEMALHFLYRDGEGNFKCDILLGTLSNYFQIPPQVVREKIRELAKN